MMPEQIVQQQVATCLDVSVLVAAALEQARRVLRSRSIVFLVSDFQLSADARTRFERALGGVAVRHDVIPVVLADPADAAVPEVGVLRVMDPETGRTEYVDTDVAFERFAKAARQERAELARLFRRLGMDEIELRTDRPVSTAVLSFFRRRERRLRR